jgi:hypothetical protein
LIANCLQNTQTTEKNDSHSFDALNSISSVLSSDLVCSLIPIDKLKSQSGPISITLPEIEDEGMKITSEIILNFDNETTKKLIDTSLNLADEINYDENLQICIDKPDTCLDLDFDSELEENDAESSRVRF